MSWLLDTLLWTGALIALVLVLRRPVARYFGAAAAYALWALPMLRLIMPPIELPAWMAPRAVPNAPAGPIEVAPAQDVIFHAHNAAVSAVPAFDWTPVLLTAWLAGVLTILLVRFRAYHRMRETLLANAVEVGRVGEVRLVETPLTEAPIAFGVRDKVVALPEGFLDRTPRLARDLALEHELAHHRGQDLLVNFLVQPLFALHWFNPLCWLGWRALRCDQEAACDARVVATRSIHERAQYAEVIASFATGPRLVLAAPMACPVLGDKSIIRRLRSLTMNDVSLRRRRTGLLGLGLAAAALPFTATLTYAEEPSVPAPPVPPKAPSAIPVPPAPPVAPDHPSAVEDLPSFEDAIREVEVEQERVGEQEAHVHVLHDEKAGKDGKVRKVEVRRIHAEGMSAEERAELKAELAEAMAEMRADLAEARAEYQQAMIEMKDELGDVTVIEGRCERDSPMVKETTKDGKKVMVLCKTGFTAQARHGLVQARRAIAGDSGIDEKTKSEVLRSLDEEIANLDREG